MNYLKQLFTALLLLCSVVVNAYDFKLDGIYYYITDDTNKTVGVTYRESTSGSSRSDYTGNVLIPETVTYNNITYTVTNVGDKAFYNCSGLTSVTIPGSVTSIGWYAFNGCSGLTSVTIPGSVTSIGWYAFNGCSKLTSVTIPGSVTSIGWYAFNGCSKLNNLVIGEGVKNIDVRAFENCSSLENVTIPNSVESMGDNVFAGTPWYANLPSGLIYVGNILYKYKGIMPTNTSIIVEEGTLGIAGDAFSNCSGLTNIEIPNTVTSIGHSAFEYCTGLTSIKIPNSVTSIGNYTFSGCKNLKTVYNYSNLNIAKGSQEYGDVAYYAEEVINCYIENDFVFGVFDGVNTLLEYLGNETELVLPDNYKGENYIIAEEAFKNNKNLVSVTIPKGVTSIGDWAFYNCTGLTSVEFNAENCTTMGSSLYPVFYGCTTLSIVTIGENVTSIPSNAFYGCTGITSIEIPNSVTNIGNNAFAGCTGLKRVDLNTQTVGNWFSGISSLKEVVTGSGVTSIAGYAFSGCTGLTSVTIGSKVASIGNAAFQNCNDITKVFWLGNTPPSGYSSLSGKINYVANNQYSNLTGEVVVSQFLSSKFEIDGTVFIPASLSDRTCYIADYNVLSNVAKITVDNTVTYQGVSLKVQDIMPYSFYRKENLEEVTFNHDGGIGAAAFEWCTSLENVEIPHTVTFVGDHAFRNCKKLTDAKIAERETVLPLGVQLFANSALETLYIGCRISYEVSGKALSPFSESSTLKSVVITNTESNIYDYEFYKCTELESAVVGDGVEKIGRWAFSGCLNLSKFVFGSNLEEIGEEAFSDCTGLTEITGRAVLPPVCGDQALDDINKWNCKLYVPSINLKSYNNAEQWKEFLFVEELVTTDNYVTYKIDEDIYKTLLIKPGERIVLPAVENREGYVFSGWKLDGYISAAGYPVMPDKDITITGSFVKKGTGIDEVTDGILLNMEVYDLNGHRIVGTEHLERGIYIINGKKVLVK